MKRLIRLSDGLLGVYVHGVSSVSISSFILGMISMNEGEERGARSEEAFHDNCAKKVSYDGMTVSFVSQKISR